MIAVDPTARFGIMALEGHRIVRYGEKPSDAVHTTNGGFFVVQPDAGPD